MVTSGQLISNCPKKKTIYKFSLTKKNETRMNRKNNERVVKYYINHLEIDKEVTVSIELKTGNFGNKHTCFEFSSPFFHKKPLSNNSRKLWKWCGMQVESWSLLYSPNAVGTFKNGAAIRTPKDYRRAKRTHQESI